MKRLIMCMALTLTVAVSAVARTDIYEQSLDANLNEPDVPEKCAERVTDFQYTTALGLSRQDRYTVELMRDGEVIVVTIPADALFAPNDTVLARPAYGVLKPLLDLLKPAGFYKVLLAMHSCDTGSPRYATRLTMSRVNAVYDWLEANGSVEYVVPYAMGSDDPLEDNDSMEHRRANRRLEVYIVPDDVMIARAKKGKIKK